MALSPIVMPTVKEVGERMVYRFKGKFISKNTYDALMRRNPFTGKFEKAAVAAKRLDLKKSEAYLRAQLGAPPAGKSWVQIAAKYAERFADYLEDLESEQ